MLAHQVVEVAVAALRDVPVGARIPQGAVTLEVGLADGPRVWDAEPLGGQQEGTEGERVARVLVLEDLDERVDVEGREGPIPRETGGVVAYV